VYPTGLPSQGVAVAIPHADPVHVNQSAIALATLQKPVSFSMMGNPQETLGVKIVMLLAIQKPDEHLELLKNLMGMLQNGALLLRIAEATSKEEVVELFGNFGGD
jgi:PTS system galactitol-specific IIA component